MLSVVVAGHLTKKPIAYSEVVAHLLAVPEIGEIVIVNDCSTDRIRIHCPPAEAENPKVNVTHHPVNKGKTEALKTGFAMTTGQIVIVQDVDLEYAPRKSPT